MKEEQFCPQIQKPSMADLSKKGWRLQGGSVIVNVIMKKH